MHHHLLHELHDIACSHLGSTLQQLVIGIQCLHLSKGVVAHANNDNRQWLGGGFNDGADGRIHVIDGAVSDDHQHEILLIALATQQTHHIQLCNEREKEYLQLHWLAR